MIDVLIRGIDDRFLRDIERNGWHSAREFLFWRLGRLADPARTLYEYAVLSASETISAARTWQPDGTRASTTLFRVRVQSLFLSESVATWFRREFTARPADEKPHFTFVRCDLNAAPAHAARRASAAHASATGAPPDTASSSATASASTPADGAASASASSSRAPPADAVIAGPPLPPAPSDIVTLAPTAPIATATTSTAPTTVASPHVFGALFSPARHVSFRVPDFDARATEEAAATARHEATLRAQDEAHGLHTPRPFAEPAFVVTVTPTSRASSAHTESAPSSAPATPNPFTKPAHSRSTSSARLSLSHASRVPLLPVVTPSASSVPTPPDSAAPLKSSPSGPLPSLTTAPSTSTVSERSRAEPESSSASAPSTQPPTALVAAASSATTAPPPPPSVVEPAPFRFASGVQWPSSVGWIATSASTVSVSDAAVTAGPSTATSALPIATVSTPAAPARPEHDSRRRGAEPVSSRGGKRAAIAEAGVERPSASGSPPVSADASVGGRLSRFAYDESRSGVSTPATLVIADEPPAGESSALDVSRACSRTPLLPDAACAPRADSRSMELESPRSPSPPRQHKRTSSTETQTLAAQTEPARAASSSSSSIATAASGPATPTAFASARWDFAREAKTFIF